MCFLTFASKKVSGRCWNGWIPYNNSCYLFPNVNADWFEAQFQCVTSFGGYLAEINNSDENAFLVNEARIFNAADPNKNGYWIGGSDMEVEGVWLWMKNRQRFTFTDWHNGEPNNSGGHEDCVFLSLGGNPHWFDSSCSTKKYFVCEKSNLPQQTEIIG